jgi:hypothetical protein
MDMDKRAKVLGWGGLIGGGVVSVSANVRSLWVPNLDGTALDVWRKLPTPEPTDAGAFVMAVFLPLAALVGVEMVNHWTHLHKALRFGVLGLVTFAALASSFTHIVTVLVWYGQPVWLAVLATIAVDGIMILSGLALFTSAPDTRTPDMDTDTEYADSLSDLDTDMSGPDTDTPDTALDMDSLYVPDMDSLPDAPVSAPPVVVRTPRPRTPDTPSWMDTARDLLDGYSDSAIARIILADAPDTWTTVEAGRKAVSRLRKASESA